MTEEQIKEMLNGIINNGEKWECIPPFKQEPRGMSAHCWQPYKLGDEIHNDYEYRKIKTWFVYGHVNNFKLTSEFDTTLNIWHKGSKEECEKWIEENTKKKTWLEEYLIQNLLNKNSIAYEETRYGITNVCKKILEKVRGKIAEKQKLGFSFSNIDSEELKEIIKELGVEL